MTTTRRGDGLRLFIATPAYSDVCADYAHGLAGTTAALTSRGIPFDIAILTGCCYVTQARDILFAQFLASDATHLLWIDSDIGFKSQDVLALLGTGKDCVGIAYPMKTTPPKWTVHFRMDEERRARVVDGLVEVEELGTGFLMLSRACADRIEREVGAGLQNYRSENARLTEEVEARVRPYFATVVGPTGYWVSEDYVFCRRWRAIGGEVWLYPGSTVAHVGAQRFEVKPSDLFGPAGG